MVAARHRGIAAQVLVALAALFLIVWAWRADLAWFERHVYPGYCAVSRAHSILPVVARIVSLAVAGLLLVLVRPRLARWAARSSAIDLALVAAAIAAALVVSELLLRRRPVGDATPLTRRDMPQATGDPRLGWRFVPDRVVSFVIHGRRIEYVIDAHGDRARAAASAIDPARPTIVLAGESIAFGEGLRWDETLAAHLVADLGVQVMNVGVPAYGSDQAYLRTVDALARLRRPVAVVTLFVPQMVRRTGQTHRPHLELEDGLLVPARATSAFGLSRLWRDEPYHGDRALDLTRAIVAATVRHARDHGAAPLFLVTNIGPACGEGAWLYREIFDAQHIPTVRVVLGPGDTIGHGDPHPNARGARKLADAVEARLRSAGVASRR
jgi:hypothetical protein